MDRDNLNISNIETFLNEKFDNIISKNTFVGSKLPDKASIPNTWKDICLIDIPNGVQDREAFGQGTVLVYLYARPMESGRKNVGILAQMEQRLNEILASNTDSNYSISRRLTFTGYNRDIDWHFNVVELTLLVG